MSVFTKLAASIFAPQDAGGTPRGVVNGEVQTWGTELERVIDAAVAAGNFLLYETKAALDADLAHDANTAALVVGDSTSNDGLYVKSGASGAGSWSRVGDVPGYSFIRATDAGGSANAIAATTILPINETQLIVLPINLTNDGTPVTVSFNGGSALTIKTAAGNNPAIGGLVSGTVVAGYKDSSTFRMLSDQASTAIQAAAEAAQAAAEAAEANAEASATEAAGSVIPQFVTKASAEAYTPNGTDPDYIRFLSETGLDPSNGGQDWLGKKGGAEPSHANWIRNRAGAGSYYERVPASPRVPAGLWEFGVEGRPNQGSGVNATTAFNKMLVAAANSGFKSYQFPPGQMYFNSRPNDIEVPGLELYGPGMRDTNAYYKNFESGGTIDAILNFRLRNFRVRDFRFVGIAGSQNAGGTSGTGCFLSVVSDDPAQNIGYFEIDDIECTSDGTLPNGHACVYVNIALQGLVGANPGYAVRSANIRGLKLFGGEIGALWLDNCTNMEITGQGTFLAGGLSGKVLITGTSTYPCTGNLIDFAHISDGLTSYEASHNVVRAAKWDGGTISLVSTAINTIVEGTHNSVTVSNAAGSSTVRNQFGVVGQHIVAGTTTGIGTSYTTVNFPTGVTFASAPIVTANVIGAGSGGLGVDIGAIGTSSFTAAVASGTEDIVWTAVGTRAT